MSTASYELAQAIPDRVKELLVLVRSAKKFQNEDESLYNALCRSTCVLMASHLEGFIKELSRSIISDLNYNLDSFSQMPLAMQRTFCQKIAYYEGVSKAEVEGRIRQLINFFSKNSVYIDMTAFPYKENPNKNPSPSQIDGVMDRLGIPDILTSIAIPAYEVVFDNDDRTNYRLNRAIIRFVSHLYFFPFKAIPSPYSPNRKKERKTVKGEQTLWHTFIEETMTRRHNIVHGDILSNDTSWEELQRDTEKLRILMYGILFSTTNYLVHPNI